MSITSKTNRSTFRPSKSSHQPPTRYLIRCGPNAFCHLPSGRNARFLWTAIVSVFFSQIGMGGPRASVALCIGFSEIMRSLFVLIGSLAILGGAICRGEEVQIRSSPTFTIERMSSTQNPTARSCCWTSTSRKELDRSPRYWWCTVVLGRGGTNSSWCATRPRLPSESLSRLQ